MNRVERAAEPSRAPESAIEARASATGGAAGRRFALTALIVVALAAHGAQVAELGLYWDDAIQYLQGHHSAAGDTLRFITSDTSRALPTERPLWFVAGALARAAYAWSVPAMHGLLLLLMLVNAYLVTRVALRLCADPGVAWAAGALFLTLPLAPLQLAWASTVHYPVGLALALLAMLSSERAVARGGRAFASFLPAAAAYLGSILTQELFLLLPLAWLAGLALWPATGASSSSSPASAARWSALRGLAVLLFVTLVYGLWRRFLLPIYGIENYPTPTLFEPLKLVRRGLASLQLYLWPWGEAGEMISTAELPPRVVAGAVLAAVVAAVALFAAPLRGRFDPTAPSRLSRAGGVVARAALLVLAAVATRAFVPVEGVRLLWTQSRFNFVALPAVALLAAALLDALVPARHPLSRYVRGALAAAVAVAVATGALFHGVVKEQLVREWRTLDAALESLRAQAPALADGTFVVVTGRAFHHIAQHEEMSSLVMALYDNPTLMGNDLKRLRVEQGGVVSTTYGRRAHWFRPREHPIIAVDATEPLPDLELDRLVLYRGHGPKVVAAETFVVGRGARAIKLRHRKERILDGPVKASRAWAHLDSIRKLRLSASSPD